MILPFLLLSTALAQEPQVFDPVPVDVEVNGEMLKGILIDEKTFMELGELRTIKKEQDAKIAAYQDFESWSKEHLNSSLLAIKTECVAGQERLTTHYEEVLKREKRKDFFQKHGFSFGVAIGVIGATALTVAVLNVYDVSLPTSVTGE